MKKKYLIALLFLLFSNQAITQPTTAEKDTVKFIYDEASKKLEINSPYYFGIYITDIPPGFCKDVIFVEDDNFQKRESYFIRKNNNKNLTCNLGTININSDSLKVLKKLYLYFEDTIKGTLSNDKKAEITVDIKKVKKDTTETAIETPAHKESKNISIIVLSAIGFVVALIVVLYVVLKNKRRKRDTFIPEQNTFAPTSIETTNQVGRSGGLSHVWAKKGLYYEIDMKQVFTDTAVCKIFLHYSVVKKTYDFFKKFLESGDKTCETGCFFVGCYENAQNDCLSYNISVEELVEPGDDLVPDEFSFDFGYEINKSMRAIIRNLSEKTGRDYVQTVWMHSHPGIGLFLSSQDLGVQDLLKSRKAPGRLVAFVIDTNSPTWEFAIFTAQKNGEMNNRENMKKIFSLDSIYEWSRSIHPSPKETDNRRDLDNYFASGSIHIGGRCISNIEDIVYNSEMNNQISGRLIGEVDGNDDIYIDACEKNTNTSSMGVIILDNETPYEMLFTKWKDETSSCLVVMIYRSDDEILIASRKTIEDQFPSKDVITVLKMKDMREWMRRKRAYR